MNAGYLTYLSIIYSKQVLVYSIVPFLFPQKTVSFVLTV